MSAHDAEKPGALVIRTAGTNCDAEMCRAFELAGARVELVHLDEVIAHPARLSDCELVGFPGGFSYGDDAGAGRVLAMKIREHLYVPLRAAAERGVLMIGACNGFQALVQTGLLPGCEPGCWPAERFPAQTVALAANAGARFIDQWVRVEVDAGSSCVWTRGLLDGLGSEVIDDVVRLPIAHGEGRLVAVSDEVLRVLRARGQVALRYVDNVNGSSDSIAGLCDPSGRIFGLMPHPERYLDWTSHPFWTRLDPAVRSGETPGLRMFRAAVAAARAGVPAGV